jgi:hypothetical protein
MQPRTRPARHPRPTHVGGPRARGSRPPQPPAKPPFDPRAFLSRLRYRIAAATIVTFSAFLALAAVNVVGVTAQGATVGGQAAASPGTTVAPTLPSGDFFGLPGSRRGAAAPVAQPLLVGGGPPMLSSGGS